MRQHLINQAVQAYRDIHSDSRTPPGVIKLHYGAIAEMTFDEFMEYLTQTGQSQDMDSSFDKYRGRTKKPPRHPQV